MNYKHDCYFSHNQVFAYALKNIKFSGAQEESNADKVDSKTVSGFAAGCANGSLMNSSPTHSVPISEGSPLHTSLLPPASSASSSKMNFRTPHQPISSNEVIFEVFF